jgi:NADH-quinone oxidoreductase subunit J
MSLYALIFYTLTVIIVVSTALAITRRNVMHAVVYLALSFLGTALLFYLLGAPFLAALEAIIYAGAIMVLFLFIVMMLEIRPTAISKGAFVVQWLPALVLAGACLAVAVMLIGFASGPGVILPLSAASPLAFGAFLFQKYWLAVEIASYLLFVALVGALYLGRREENGKG